MRAKHFITEDWQKVNKKDKTDGMSQKAVNAYRRENPGSKLKTAVTTKPSKLKKGSKASKRRSSYCSRSAGQMDMHNISCAKTPDKAICKARRRWNCEEDIQQFEQALNEAKKGLYYYVNKRKKAGTSRSKNHPDAPSAQDWKNAAKTAKNESMAKGNLKEFAPDDINDGQWYNDNKIAKIVGRWWLADDLLSNASNIMMYGDEAKESATQEAEEQLRDRGFYVNVLDVKENEQKENLDWLISGPLVRVNIKEQGVAEGSGKNKAYTQGEEAGKKSHRAENNPYKSGSPEHREWEAGRKGTVPDRSRFLPSKEGVAEGKIKGVDGKACWKGKRYAGKVKKADGTYKDKCVPTNEAANAAQQAAIAISMKKAGKKPKSMKEDTIGTASKRPARPGSRPDRGHIPVSGYRLDELNDETIKSYISKAEKQVKDLEPHAKRGEYKDIAKRMIDRRERGLEMARRREEWYDSEGRPNPRGAYDAGGHYHLDRDLDEDSLGTTPTKDFVKGIYSLAAEYGSAAPNPEELKKLMVLSPNGEVDNEKTFMKIMTVFQQQIPQINKLIQDLDAIVKQSEENLEEEGKASRKLCTSSKPDDELGASQLASCKSQGLRARDGNKSHKLGKSPKSRVVVGGHRIKGRKYGGPLPDWS